MLAEFKEYVTRFTQFLDLLQVRDNCAKFHHFMLCVIYFREGGPFCFTLSLSCPENAHLDRVQNLMANICFLLTQCAKVIWRAEFASVIRGDRYQRWWQFCTITVFPIVHCNQNTIYNCLLQTCNFCINQSVVKPT